MGTLVKVAKTTDFQAGAKKKVSAGDKTILLVKDGDAFYAVDNRCPHMGGDLSLGTLDGAVITCPRHSSQFDVKTGTVTRWLKGAGLVFKLASFIEPPKNLKTYAVKVEGEDISVEV